VLMGPTRANSLEQSPVLSMPCWINNRFERTIVRVAPHRIRRGKKPPDAGRGKIYGYEIQISWTELAWSWGYIPFAWAGVVILFERVVLPLPGFQVARMAL